MTVYKYTQAEFDALPVKNGRRQCPTGDYSAIRIFGEGCSFEGGHNCRTDNPYFATDRIGSTLRKAYFFDFKDGLYVRSGCFFGPEAEFLTKLHADGDAHKTATYTAALALAKLQLGIEAAA